MQIKSADSNLQIDVIARSHPDSDDYWDGNWLESEIRINAPGIKVLSGITLRAEDFLRFYEGLKKMQDGQMQEVEFTTNEDNYFFNISSCWIVCNSYLGVRNAWAYNVQATHGRRLDSCRNTGDLFWSTIAAFCKVLNWKAQSNEKVVEGNKK